MFTSKTKQELKLLKHENEVLKLTTDQLILENTNLKLTIQDLKVTVQKNKEMLNEYVENVTSKDAIFQKMKATIANLKDQLRAVEKQTNELYQFKQQV